MSTLSWMTRVRAFFAGKHEPAPAMAGESAWSGGTGTLALVGTAVAEEAPATETVPAAPTESRRPPQPDRASPPPPPAMDRNVAPPGTSRIDPLDPPWLERLEALGSVGRELRGHRERGEALLHTLRQLPELTSDQTDHIVRTNRLIERQNILLSSMLDTLSGMAASMETMEEGSRRHLTAIGQLEASHRDVLFGYQRMLEKTHRRLGRLATLATVLAAVALGGVAWVVYLVLAAG
jgi:hypothetical protein